MPCLIWFFVFWPWDGGRRGSPVGRLARSLQVRQSTPSLILPCKVTQSKCNSSHLRSLLKDACTPYSDHSSSEYIRAKRMQSRWKAAVENGFIGTCTSSRLRVLARRRSPNDPWSQGNAFTKHRLCVIESHSDFLDIRACAKGWYRWRACGGLTRPAR